MKILVAGATGALGKQLVPRLLAAGHEVVGMTRGEAKCDALRAIALSMLSSVVEELAQEARLRMHRAHQQGQRISSPRTYLARVTTLSGTGLSP